MRCAAVSFATVAAEARWDARHYLGAVKQHEDAVERARENLKVAQGRLAGAQQRLANEKQRVKDILKSGNLKEIGT